MAFRAHTLSYGGIHMIERRLLLGFFDLMHVGHLTQIDAVAAPGVDLIVVVVSDSGVREISGSDPFLPEDEREALVGGLRRVSVTAVTGPEIGWELPAHDKLYVDARLLRDFSAFEDVVDLRDAVSVKQTSAPAHPALARTA